MEEKLNKIIEMLEDLTIKIDYLEVDIEELKNGESIETKQKKLSISNLSLAISRLRASQLGLQDEES